MFPSAPISDNSQPSTTSDQWADLKTYAKAKQVVARQIRSLSNFFQQHKNEQGVEQSRELMVKLAEDRFTLAVVGQFKRGKTSLMNAIVGQDILPTGILPVTSAVTILRFGPHERLLIPRPNTLLSEEAPVSALPDYVTQELNPGNRKRIERVYLELPLPFLRRGVEFVDTPGVGSAIEANTATTMSFLPHCDAAVFVTSADSPMTAVETAFLADIREHADKVFFVVNKIDLLEDREREEVLGYISQTIQRQTGATVPRVFSVSSRLGLQARLAGDSERYAASGLAALEETLAGFLTSEKSDALLLAVVNKSLRLAAGHAELVEIEERIATLRDAIEQHRASESVLREVADVEMPVSNEEAVPGQVAAPPTDADVLLKAMATQGCPVCNHLAETAFAFFARWQSEVSSNEQTQRVFADELGFCPLHTWQLADLSSILGLCTGYPRLLERLVDEFSSIAASTQDAPDSLAWLRDHVKTCRVCSVLRDAEEQFVARMATVLSDSAGQQVYAASQGVCLRHLLLLLTAVQNPKVETFLLAEAARHFERWAEDMESYAIKRDALRRGLQNADEEHAHLRALIHLAGNRSLCLPRAGDHL